MLCLDVSNFKAPETNFTYAVGDTSIQPDLPDKINTFYYNHIISVITPGLQSIKHNILNDSQYYKVANLPVDALVDRNFIGNFIKQGNLTALTIDTRIDCDNCICITPSGKLILSLTRESYLSLGLQGKPSQYPKRSKEGSDRYIVTLDLIAKQFSVNKKNADVPKCLKKLGCFTFIMSWDPPSPDLCPSSVAKYFHDLGVSVEVCTNKYSGQALGDRKVPIVQYEKEEDVHTVIEWLGITTMKCDANAKSFVSSYEVPSPNVVVPSLCTHQFRGMFTAAKVRSIIDELRKLYSNQWFSIYVQGFSDSPVNWKYNEQNYYTNGDNAYLFLFSRYKYLFATHHTSNKRYK